jgi:catechol 2,3-dioxygenase-like lactoylglutathione lyase family enzyme
VSQGQFRFGYFARNYDATVAFYREGLELEVIESWDRGADDRGTLFAAESGGIEVLATPEEGESFGVFDTRPPRGAFMVIESRDVETRYERAVAKQLPIKEPLTDQKWGHRSFCVTEPNGLILYFFRDLNPHGRVVAGS